MTRRREQRQAADRKRSLIKPSRKWYGTRAWKRRRAIQLNAVPWCEPCKRAGRSRPANTANHNPRHNEDRHAFFHGPLESVCAECHNSPIQRAEFEGFSREIDGDGWPVDPAHPFNARAVRRERGVD